jgi:alpha-galactosidase
MVYNWKAHTITDTVSKTGFDFDKTTYKLRDLWAKRDAGTTDKPLKQNIPAYDVLVLRLEKE